MASVSFFSLLVIVLALSGPSWGQEDYQPAQGGGDIPPPQHNIQPHLNNFGGNHEAFLASFQAQQHFQDQPIHQAPIQNGQYQNQYSGGPLQDQQLVTKVFVKPDGGITTIQVPQNFNFRR